MIKSTSFSQKEQSLPKKDLHILKIMCTFVIYNLFYVSMATTENQIFSSIKAGNPSPIYLITGEEDYYIDLVSDFLEQNIVDADYRDFDQVVLYGRDVSMLDIISRAKQYPMASARQLILVKEAQDITSKDGGWDLITTYCENPQPQTVMAFCFRHKKFDKRSKAYKAIANAGTVYEHAKLYENQIPAWIAQYVNSHDYAITEKSAVLIAQQTGNNLSRIANELDKLFIVLPPKTTINDAVVEQHIGISREYNIFELQNAIGRRDIKACNTIVNHFAKTPKDNPIQMVLPLLYKYFIDLMIYIQNPADLKVNPFFLKDYAAASKNYPLPKLASCIGYLYEADCRSKGISSRMEDGEILKELIFKIIH